MRPPPMPVSRRVPPNLGQALQEAVTLQQQGRLREAEKIYTRVLKALPDQFDALNLLGTIKAQRGQAGEAYRLISAALKVNPRAPDAWVNLGIVLHALKRDQEALESFDKALALKPGDVDALHQRANALLTLGRAQDALSAIDQVLSLAPRHPQARLNRGLALAALGRHGEALGEFDAALAMPPDNPAAHYNRGISLFSLDRYGDAVAAYDRALSIAPDHVKALNNRGLALQALNRHDAAVASYSKALEIRKDYADAHFNQALALLTIGDFRRGFEQYEWRWRRTGMPAQGRGYGRPRWLGEYPLQRNTILLHAEQGLGDTIQFARYVPLLARMGAKVVLEVQPQLAPLLRQLEGVVGVVARGEPLPPRSALVGRRGPVRRHSTRAARGRRRIADARAARDADRTRARRFRRYRGRRRPGRSRHHRRYLGRASCGCDGTTGLDSGAVLTRLALDARGRGQPVVSDRATVQAAFARRLGQRDRAPAWRARPLRARGLTRDSSGVARTRPATSVRSIGLRSTRAYGVDNAGKDTGPIACARLPEQAGRRVPGAVVAIEQPTPFRHMHERHECGPSQRAREVSDRVARGDDEVEIHHHRGAVEKRAATLIEAVSQRLHLEGGRGNVFDACPLLQRDQAHARNCAQGGELAQRNRAQLVQMGGAGVLPGDPDSEAMGAETLSPGGHAVGLGRQEPPVPGHGFGSRPNDAGYSHHRGPADVGRPRQNRDVGHHAFHAGHRPQQRLQTRLGPQRDPISELGEMGAEAGEQKLVSEPLFASEHQQFVLQAFAAPGRPSRRRKALRGADLERDAPLVSWPRLAPTAVEQFEQGDRVEGLIVIGRDLQAVADVSQGLREAAEHIERLGAVRMKQPAHGVVAIERDRAIEASHRLLEAGLLPEHHAAAELRFRHIGADRQRALIARERLVVPAQPRERIAAVEMDFGEIRLARKRAVETVDGGFVAARRGQRISAVGVRRGEVRS